MRHSRIWPRSVEAIVAAPDHWREDDEGNPIAVGRDARDRVIEVVLALDDPDFVITVILRRKQR
jgi:hypothetical protein